MRLAVLATIVERPGLRYDISTRFNRRFGPLLGVTDRRIYQVVEGLLADGFVEILPTPSAESRLDHYGATKVGEQVYTDWLAEGVHEDEGRTAIRVAFLAALSPERMLMVLDAHEERVLETLAAMGPPRRGAPLAERLAVLHERMALDRELDFVRHARAEIEENA